MSKFLVEYFFTLRMTTSPEVQVVLICTLFLTLFFKKISSVSFSPVPPCSEGTQAKSASSSVVGGCNGKIFVFSKLCYTILPAPIESLLHIPGITLFMRGGVIFVLTIVFVRLCFFLIVNALYFFSKPIIIMLVIF